MKNKKIVVISLLVLVIGFIFATYAFKSNESSKVSGMVNSKSESPLVREHSPKFGDNKKGVVVVEFIDPQCPPCGAFHPIMKKMYKEYYEDISLVIKYIPNHQHSRFAVKLLEAARLQGKYTEALDAVFSNQDKWADVNNPKPELLWTFISQIDGIDIEKVKVDIKNPIFDEMMDIDANDSRTLGARGTPTIFVNGKKLEVLSYRTLSELVESEIYK
ncbi:DsbA family protein [Poseidonibacter lekithochrous]|uniref:DsbA family protein n=1 Tax=Poseidonibacter TaxID=2321187 RepID=UPI001C094F4A|nr:MULTISPECIES: thioredoxin domain-containing protein [Poseidonibacter]MBU3015190.1 DsbA family protein [Poseidonibacter lekithochrous]MDO6828487.1 thioredoxin domain-containing protein [Poseidonibacter sp. 1_MG-2023]